MTHVPPAGRRAPSPPALPIVGHLPSFVRDKLGFLRATAERYGDVVRLRLGTETYLLRDPADIQHVLETNHLRYEKTPRLTGSGGKRLTGDGLLTSSAASHRSLRLTLQPVFHRTAIDGFAAPFLAVTRDVLAGWAADGEVDVAAEMMRLAHHGIGRTLFGLDFLGADRGLADAFTVRRRYVHLKFALPDGWLERLPLPICRSHAHALRRIDAAIYALIRRRRESPGAHHDMLASLVALRRADGSALSDEQVRDEAITLSITGYETIGEALAWTLYLISQHPDVEARLVEELDGLGGAPPDASALPRLGYLAMVLDESLRLYPPTWLFVRIARERDRLPSGVEIPPGAKMYLCPWVTHRNPRYFPDPDRFDPERFGDAARQGRPRLAYFPFGAGPRICIGQAFARTECLVALATILREWRLTLPPGRPVVPDPRVTLTPKGGLRMHRKRRPNWSGRQ